MAGTTIMAGAVVASGGDIAAIITITTVGHGTAAAAITTITTGIAIAIGELKSTEDLS
jgi:hypothetical protein